MNLRYPDLTGRTGVRFGMFGRLIVQVECRKPAESPGTFECYWKDAKLNEYIEASRLSAQFAAKSEGSK